MLFAACTPAAPNSLQLTAHVANNLGQQQLTSLQQLKDQHAMSLSSSSSSSAMQTPAQMSPQHQIAATGNAAAAVAAAVAARANEEAKEAMRKLDATLVAYLAGETKLQSKQLESELELELELDLNSSDGSNIVDTDEYVLEEFSDPIVETVENITREEMQLFRRIKSIKLQLEALTLEPEGTKRMELLQNDTRPIFTVECQLSHELIQQLPRYEMFHIMQFESEKFHSLTQCTRFGQEAQRDINLTPLIDALDNTLNGNGGAAPNFGRIHFAVWWREPGTCLNEMLGMGVFELRELYDAALLEQCKRITIQRRGVPLANIYLKINLLLCSLADTNNNNAADLSCEAALQAMKQHTGGNKNKKGGSAGGNGKSAANAPTAAATSANPSNTTAKEDNTKDNNEEKVATSSDFKDDTLVVRLLTGLISISEVCYKELPPNSEFIMVCERFWKTEVATAKATGAEQFYYQEQFSVLRDENFLNQTKKSHLRVRIYQRQLNTSFGDFNGNPDEILEPLGVVLLPLHQFYIAFCNDEIANRLVSEQLPVISVDNWLTIHGMNGQGVGQLKCLLAIGSEQQINNLKRERGIKPLHTDFFSNIRVPRCGPLYKSIRMPSEDCKHVIGQPAKKKSIRTTVEVMGMLQEALQQAHLAREQAKNPQTSPTTSTSTLSRETTLTEDDEPLITFEPSTSAAAGLTKPTEPTCATDNTPDDTDQSMERPQFKFELTLTGAVGLPLNQSDHCSPAVCKRFPPGEPPSTYVTFEATDCVGSSSCYKSQEGNVYASKIVMRSLVPHWLQKFVITVDEDYLTKPKKTFVLKLWKKANVPPANDSACTSTAPALVPTPNEDVIIGFTSLPLSVFLQGLHLAGCFHVFDFNGHIMCRIELEAKASDDWYVQYLVEKVWEKKHKPPRKPPVFRTTPGGLSRNIKTDKEIIEFGKSHDISHLNLNEAVNHKYNELKVISDHLRTRLVDVTGESLSEIFNLDDLNNWQPLNEVIEADVEMDSEWNEFERDINDPSAAVNDVNTNNSDNKDEKLISKTAPGAAEPTIE